jgi:hypothetical protein
VRDDTVPSRLRGSSCLIGSTSAASGGRSEGANHASLARHGAGFLEEFAGNAVAFKNRVGRGREAVCLRWPRPMGQLCVPVADANVPQKGRTGS